MKTQIKVLIVSICFLLPLNIFSQVSSFTSPAASSTVSSNVNFVFDFTTVPNAGTVKITFTENGTTLDASDPHILVLAAAYEASGSHNFFLNATNFSGDTDVASVESGGNNLVDGAVYDVKIEYNDGSPHENTNNSITYDISTSAPTLATPSTSSTDNSSLDIDFTLPEAAFAGSVKMTFTRTGGSADGNAPHVITFAAGFETAAQHTTTLDGTDLSNNANVSSVASDPNDALVDGAIYSVKIEYQDALGNPLASVTNTSFTYDISTSAPTLTTPSNSSTYNSSLDIDFTLPEAAFTGSVKMTFTQTGGSADANAPHVITFAAGFETAAQHTTTLDGSDLSNNGNVSSVASDPNDALVDGAIYSVKIEYQDALGNPVASVTNTSFIYDISAPTPTITSSSSPGPINGNFTVTIEFVEDVTGFTATDISLSANATKGTFNVVDGSTYTLVVNPTSDGPVTVDIVAAICQDLASNDNNVASQFSITYDGTAPTLDPVHIESDNDDPTAATTDDIVTLTFTGNEGLKDVVVTIANNGVGLSSDPTGKVWTATYTMQSSDSEGFVLLSVAFKDSANNDGSLVTTTTDASSVEFMKNPPILNTATIVSNHSNNDKARVGSVVSLSIISPKEIKNVSATIATQTATIVKNSKTNYTASYAMASGDLEGEIPFTIDFTNKAGVPGATVSSTTNASKVVFDKTDPVLDPISIVSNHANTNWARSGSFITLSFSSNEGVENVSAEIAEQTVSVINDDGGIGKQWLATYEMTGTDSEGTIALSISCADSAGNAITGINSITTGTDVTFDKTDPILSDINIISDNAESNYSKVGDQVTLSFTSNEEVENVNVKIAENIIPLLDISNVGNDWSAVYTMQSSDNEGELSFSIDYNDMAGNSGNQKIATDDLSTVIFDKTKPILTPISIRSDNDSENTAIIGDEIIINFTASETIRNISDTIEGNAATAYNITGNKWAVIDTVDGTYSGNVDFTIDFEDVAGNVAIQVTATDDASYVSIDGTPPTLSNVSISSNHTNSDYAGVGHDVALNFTASETIKVDSVKIEGQHFVATNVSGNEWMAIKTMSGSDSEGVIQFSIDYKDNAGNIGATKSIVDIGTDVTFDKTAPSAPVISGIADGTYKDDQVFTVSGSGGFFEYSTDNGLSWTPYTIDVTLDADGTTYQVLAKETDSAGNVSVNSVLYTVVIDKTGPALNSITVSSGSYSVNEEVSVTISSDADDYNLSVAEVNGKTANFTNNLDNTYKITYIVQEGDDEWFEQTSLPVNIILSDAVGNQTIYNVATVPSGKLSIDAVTPVIDSVKTTAESLGVLNIDSTIVFTVYTAIDEVDLDVNPKTYNGQALLWTTLDNGATYEAVYTVKENEEEHVTPLPLGDVTISDTAGNISPALIYSDIQKSIFAVKPTARITGSTSKCDYGQTVPVNFEFEGRRPYSLIYNDGTADIGPIQIDADNYQIDIEKGTFTLVNLSDSTGNYITNALEDATITVYPLPVVSFDVTASPYNVEESGDDLSQYVDSLGGRFWGEGVGSDGYFYPSIVGGESGIVIKRVYYEYTNMYGCIDTVYYDIEVSSEAGIINSLDDFYCQYQEVDTVIGTNPSGLPGTFVLTTTSGFVDLENDTLIMYPDQMLAGMHTLTYEYEEGGNTYKVEKDFEIDSIGAEVTFIGLDTEYCKDAPVVPINAVDLYPSGGFSTFQGPSNSLILTSLHSVSFFPIDAVPDENIEISYFYLSTNGCSSDTIRKNVIVHSKPELDFTLRDNYNYFEDVVDLVGNEPDGVFSGSEIVNNKLYPGLVDEARDNTEITVWYAYTDENGCSKEINKKAMVFKANETINGLDALYCYEDLSLDISCQSINSPGAIGSFSSVKGGVTPTGENTASYSLASAGHGTDTIYFRYDINGTPYEVFKEIIIDSLGVVTIYGFNEGKEYCQNDDPVFLNATPLNGVLRINNQLNNIFNPIEESIGENIIEYTFVNASTGCEISKKDTVTINFTPIVEFSADLPCTDLNEEAIKFSNETDTSIYHVNWLWSSDNADGATSAEFSPSFLYSSAGIKKVSLEASTNKGCVSYLEKDISVGIMPNARFIVEKECYSEDPVKIECTSGSESGNITDYIWKIDDMVYGGNNVSFLHEFPDTGSYNLNLIVLNESGCSDTLNTDIVIKPFIYFSELEDKTYLNDFEEGKSYWSAGSLNGDGYFSWKFGMPEGNVIDTAASGVNSFYTTISPDLNKYENSYVVSPCFDMSSMEKPMIKFNIWSSFIAGQNGAVLQYNLNESGNWIRLGNLGEGINWYNNSDIDAEPGEQRVGWSSGMVEQWTSARHDLSFLKDETNVRFRLAFATNGSLGYDDGFAFDDFWIGERKQNILMEYFTNSVYSDIIDANNNMHSVEQSFDKDMLAIHYHSGDPSGDPFYTDYPYGPSSRLFTYGVSQIPYAIYNGTNVLSFSSNNIDASVLNTEVLKDPEFEVLVSFKPEENNKVEVKLIARTEFVDSSMTLFCAVVEKEVQQTSPNGETVSYNILREFLPDPAGTLLNKDWLEDEAQTFSFNIGTDKIKDSEQVRVIAFVQNINSGIVYQAGANDISPLTGIEDDISGKSLSIYPNPVNEQLIFESGEDIKMVELFDVSGRLVKTYQPNSSLFSTSVEYLKDGVYIIRVKTINEIYTRKITKY